MMFETYKFLCLGKSTFYTVTYKLCNILKSSFFFLKVIMSYSYSIQIYVNRFYISLKPLDKFKIREYPLNCIKIIITAS